MSTAFSRRSWQQTLAIVVLLSLASVIVLAVVVYVPDVSFGSRNLAAGDVSTEDILAPEAISYVSEVLTEQQRDAAARSVPLKYTQADTNIARQQLDRL